MQMLKPLAILITLMLFNLNCHADLIVIHDDKMGVDCTYSIDENNRAVSEDSGPKGTGVCWDKRMIDKADNFINSYVLAPQNIQSDDISITNAVFAACNIGLSNQLTSFEKAHSYIKIINKFRGNGAAIKRISDSFEYGKNGMGKINCKYCKDLAINP